MTTTELIGAYALLAVMRLLRIYTWVIVAGSLLSWFVPPDNMLRRFISFLTEPVVGPFRRITARYMSRGAIPIDFSPMFAIFALLIVEWLLQQLFYYIY